MNDQKMLIGYYRLSLEDGSDGESNSIINQRKLVKDYISHIPELAELPFQELYDDGYSGSSMERPGIQQVLELARNTLYLAEYSAAFKITLSLYPKKSSP